MTAIRRLILVLLASAILLELVLQIGAFVVSTLQAPSTGHAADVAEPRNVVLCVGDSYTHGMGASDPGRCSYPAVLGRILGEEHDRDVTVANMGWPGQNSRDLLEKLDAQLRRTQPAIVCVLVGVNDAWTRPEPLALGPGESGPGTHGFVLRWRTARLVRWVLQGDAAERATGPRDGGAPASIASDGGSAAGPSDAMLAVAGQILETAGLRGRDSDPSRARYAPREPVLELERDARRLLRARDYRAAVTMLAGAVERHPDAGALLPLLAAAHARLHERDAVRAVTERMRSLCGPEPGLPDALHLLQCLTEVGDPDGSIALAKRLVAVDPELTAGWEILARWSRRQGDYETATRAYERYLQLTDGRNPARRVGALVTIARTIAEREPRKAVRLIVAAALLEGKPGRALSGMRFLERHVPAATLLSMIDLPGLDARGRALIQRVHDETYVAESTRWLGVLRGHLERIVDTCRGHGASPVLLTYPFARPTLEEVQREVAADRDVPLVPVRERFDRELLERSREELFVRDGHCNDGGYALMAELVGEVVAARLIR